MVCVKISEELLEVVAEGGSKLFGDIVDMVARISINIQEVLAVRPSDLPRMTLQESIIILIRLAKGILWSLKKVTKAVSKY